MKCAEDDEWDDWVVDADKPYDASSVKIIQKLTLGVSSFSFKFVTSMQCQIQQMLLF